MLRLWHGRDCDCAAKKVELETLSIHNFDKFDVLPTSIANSNKPLHESEECCYM